MVELFTFVIFLVLLAIAAVFDVRSLRVPNKLVLVMFAVWALWMLVSWNLDLLIRGLVGGIVLGGGVLLVALVYERLAGNHSMGGGDIKLIAAVGMFLGLEQGAFALLMACVAALPIALIYPKTRAGKSNAEKAESSSPVPFALAIAIGAAFVLLAQLVSVANVF